MPSAVRLCLLALLGCALLLGAAALTRPLFGLDLGLGALGTLAAAQERNDRLARQNRAGEERLKRKQAVTESVLDRRVTLLEAAAAFRQIDEDIEAELASTEPRRNDAPPDRELCQQVLLWVRGERNHPHDPSLLAELESEYVRLFGEAPNYHAPAPAPTVAAAE
jgi:hypothetical protein